MANRLTATAKPDAIPLRLDGLRWRRGEEGLKASRSEGLTFTPGTIVLLMGANGAGKSTLLEKIAGLRPPEGVMAAYGPDALWRRSRLRKNGLRLNGEALLRYSYAVQSPEEGLFARSVGDELTYSLRPYGLAKEECELRRGEALRAVGWESEDWLERDPYLMSGGERRRTALAAVFSAPAPWLLLDEPTAGLDGEGHRTIAGKLKELRAEGRGIVLVSHDSDWALPLADEAMLLDAAGTIRLCSREQLVRHPEWLAEAGMRVPEWLRAAHRLWRCGVPADLALDPAAAATAWKSVRSNDCAAAALVPEGDEDREAREELKTVGEQRAHEGRKEFGNRNEHEERKANGDRNEHEERKRTDEHKAGVRKKEEDLEAWEEQKANGDRNVHELGALGDQITVGDQRIREDRMAGGDQRIREDRMTGGERGAGKRIGEKRHRLIGFDPRSVWLAYALISFGLFAVRDWPGLAAGAVVVLALLAAGRISLRRWRGLIVNYAVFSVATSAIFASGAGGEWAVRGEAFADTLLTFMRTMLILLLGLAIPLVMSPLSLRRSLEQMTAIGGKSPLWAQRGILAVTLMMRFVPVLLELWERFAKIIRARGKSLAIGPAALGRKLRDTALPFLLALFRLGDEVTLALESRGVGGTRAAVRAQRLRWRAQDYGLAVGALLLALGMWLMLRR